MEHIVNKFETQEKNGIKKAVKKENNMQDLEIDKYENKTNGEWLIMSEKSKTIRVKNELVQQIIDEAIEKSRKERRVITEKEMLERILEEHFNKDNES